MNLPEMPHAARVERIQEHSELLLAYLAEAPADEIGSRHSTLEFVVRRLRLAWEKWLAEAEAALTVREQKLEIGSVGPSDD